MHTTFFNIQKLWVLARTVFVYSGDNNSYIPKQQYFIFVTKKHTCLLWGKVKFSHYRPEQAPGDPEGQGFRIFHNFRHYESGKVVTLTRRLPLPPGISWYSFLEAESTPGHMVPSVATEKNPQRHHRESIPQPYH
jgi:hypothetical protein